MQPRNVNVFFDVEGWEMSPRKSLEPPHLITSVGRIREVLESYGAKAVFNICGIIAERAPDVFLGLAEEGHEIACHGYTHENFHYLDENQLSDVLRSANECIQRSTGYPPLGIRCPWFTYRGQMLPLFKKAGYKWMSNQRTSHSELTFHSHRYRGNAVNVLAHLNDKRKWRNHPKKPYDLGGIVEIPLMSSTDTEILNEVSPEQEIPTELLTFATSILTRQFEKSTVYFNLNFHVIVIGSANRITILENMMEYISNNGGRFATAREIARRVAAR